MVRWVVEMYIKSPVITNSRGVVAATERKELNSSRKKKEKGLEKEDDEGGR